MIQQFQNVPDKNTATELLKVADSLREQRDLPKLSDADFASYVFLSFDPINYAREKEAYDYGAPYFDVDLMLKSGIDLVTPSFFQLLNGVLVYEQKYSSLKDLKDDFDNLEFPLTANKWRAFIDSENHNMFLATLQGRQDAMKEMGIQYESKQIV